METEIYFCNSDWRGNSFSYVDRGNDSGLVCISRRLEGEEIERMNCKYCSATTIKFGYDRRKLRRYKCSKCRKTFTDNRGANYFTPEWKRDLIAGLYRLGFSIRQTATIAHCSSNTATKYRPNVDRQPCKCGLSADHKDWCSIRYKQSAKRQESLHGDKSKTSEATSYYPYANCQRCGKDLKFGGGLCRPCFLERANERREKLQAEYKEPPQVLSREIREVTRLINQLEKEINNVRSTN